MAKIKKNGITINFTPDSTEPNSPEDIEFKFIQEQHTHQIQNVCTKTAQTNTDYGGIKQLNNNNGDSKYKMNRPVSIQTSLLDSKTNNVEKTELQISTIDLYNCFTTPVATPKPTTYDDRSHLVTTYNHVQDTQQDTEPVHNSTIKLISNVNYQGTRNIPHLVGKPRSLIMIRGLQRANFIALQLQKDQELYLSITK